MAEATDEIKTAQGEPRANKGGAQHPAIVFDIDGVFKAGGCFFDDGLKALTLAHDGGASVCFVTNGGGGSSEGPVHRVSPRVSRASLGFFPCCSPTRLSLTP